MKCPFCGEEDTKVIDSRPADDGKSIRRRRQCDQCQKRFTTYEKVETVSLVVIKKDATREPYERAKIEQGVFRSCHKRPISVTQMNTLIDKIESDIFNLETKEIKSSTIGELVLKALEEFDAVAYIRFASIYREFQDVDSFMAELNKFCTRKSLN